MGETRTINTRLYLDVIAQLPDVTQQDIQKTREIFTEAFGTMPEQIQFDRDFEQGDGVIAAIATVPSGDGGTRRARFFLNESGDLYSAENSFKKRLPFWSGLLFFAPIFGRSETRWMKDNNVDLRQIATGNLRTYRMMPVPGENLPPPFRTGYVPEIVDAAYSLYASTAQSGSVDTSRNSLGMRALNAVKSRIQQQEDNRKAVTAASQQRAAEAERQAAARKVDEEHKAAVYSYEAWISHIFKGTNEALAQAWQNNIDTSAMMAIISGYRLAMANARGRNAYEISQKRWLIATEMQRQLRSIYVNTSPASSWFSGSGSSISDSWHDRSDRNIGGGGRFDRPSGGSGDKGSSIGRDSGGH